MRAATERLRIGKKRKNSPTPVSEFLTGSVDQNRTAGDSNEVSLWRKGVDYAKGARESTPIDELAAQVDRMDQQLAQVRMRREIGTAWLIE